MTKEQIFDWYNYQKHNKEKLSTRQIFLLEKIPNWTWSVNSKNTIEYHIQIAEKLSKENNDKIPCGSWLTKHGYTALTGALRRRPESFAHLTQDRKKEQAKTIFIKDHIQVAEKLAKNNILPSRGWLEKHGYTALVAAIRRKPKKFIHLCQEVRSNKNKLTGYCGGSAGQRRGLEIKNGLKTK